MKPIAARAMFLLVLMSLAVPGATPAIASHREDDVAARFRKGGRVAVVSAGVAVVQVSLNFCSGASMYLPHADYGREATFRGRDRFVGRVLESVTVYTRRRPGRGIRIHNPDESQCRRALRASQKRRAEREFRQRLREHGEEGLTYHFSADGTMLDVTSRRGIGRIDLVFCGVYTKRNPVDAYRPDYQRTVGVKGHHGVFQGSGRDTGRGIVAAYLSFSRRNPLDGHETRQLFDGDGYPAHARVLLNPRVDEICAQDDHYHRLVAEERERDREYAARLEREDDILAIIVIVGLFLFALAGFGSSASLSGGGHSHSGWSGGSHRH